MDPIDVLIAIQARSNSTRFPKKIYQKIDDKMILQHVIEAAESAAHHTTKFSRNLPIRCQVAVVHPEGDDLLTNTFGSSGVLLIAGDEQNVLDRYVKAQRFTDADFVVRLTSDCPLMLDYVISKHINVAAHGRLDYVSNIEESCRSVADGFDCEVLSRRAIKWLEENATEPDEREHVTLAIRRKRPSQLVQGFVPMKIDTSHMKLSVDTPEDLERIRAYYHRRKDKLGIVSRLFGKLKYEL